MQRLRASYQKKSIHAFFQSSSFFLCILTLTKGERMTKGRKKKKLKKKKVNYDFLVDELDIVKEDKEDREK